MAFLKSNVAPEWTREKRSGLSSRSPLPRIHTARAAGGMPVCKAGDGPRQLQSDLTRRGRPPQTMAGEESPTQALWGLLAQWEQMGRQPPATAVAESSPSEKSEFVAEINSSIDKVPAEDWNACVMGSGTVNPFLLWEFLHALEESGSASRYTGWLPQHVVIKSADGSILGCCPLYLKGHSQGEYVFDHSWANAAAYMGHRYYPKLQCCVPFTPVTGARLLVKPGPLAKQVTVALARTLRMLADELKVSSMHVTFNNEADWHTLQHEGFLPRVGVQYHWRNQGYKSFNDFLMELRQPKRKSIRQERKCLEKAGLTARRLQGDDIRPCHWDHFFEFYRDTCDRKWGEAYLTKDFFYRIGELMSEKVVLVLAEDGHDNPVAGALNLVGSDTLYGRNWGKSFRLRAKHLHFELCYYQAIDAAIEMGLSRVEAGAQGQHKIQRGYLPQPTLSSHYIRIPELRSLIDTALTDERTGMRSAIDALTAAESPFKVHPK
eukprot:evm.model.scf_1672.1 EVM.evm.TU.scf_1672.1   scf_1672:2442-8539(-)